jgi:hypothetical protein
MRVLEESIYCVHEKQNFYKGFKKTSNRGIINIIIYETVR